MKPRLRVTDFYRNVEPQLLLKLPRLEQAFLTENGLLAVTTDDPASIHKYDFESQRALLSISLPVQDGGKPPRVKNIIEAGGLICFCIVGDCGLWIFQENRLWQVTTHLGPITAISSHCSNIITGSADMTVRVWKVRAEGIVPNPHKHVLCSHTGPLTCFLSVESLLLSGSSDKSIIVWSNSSQVTQRTFQSEVKGIIQCQDSDQLAVTEGNRTVSILCATTLQKEGKLVVKRLIADISLPAIYGLHQVDDSFLQLVGEQEVEMAEINLGKVMAKVSPGLGKILGSRCIRAVTLLAVADKGVFMLKY